jgi:uroporphyrinogen-III synthase
MGPSRCSGLAPLAGWRVGITADRRAEEQLELLVRRGATVLHGPAVRTLPFDDDTPLRLATDELIASPPDVVLATTGIGMRGWFGAAEAWGLDADLFTALASAGHIYARGPKVRGALQQAGLQPTYIEPSERLDAMLGHLLRAGVGQRRVALQRYGEPVPWAIDALVAAGADVVDVPVYRWTAPADDAPVRRLVTELGAGRLDAVTFTSAAAVRRFVDVEPTVRHAFTTGGVVAVAVGPFTAEALVASGIAPDCCPPRGRLGLMVRELAELARGRHRHLVAADAVEVVVQGGHLEGADAVELHGLDRALFDVLAERPGTVVGRTALLRRVWGSDRDQSAVDAGIGRLRRSLEPTGLRVQVVPRRGWALNAAEVRCGSG